MDSLLQEDNTLLLQEDNLRLWLETTPPETVFLFNQTNIG